MKFNVKAPVAVTEKVVGINFVDGQAIVDNSIDEQRRALAYFQQQGYIVEPITDDTDDEEDPGQVPDVEDPPNPAVNAPSRGASKADWLEYIVTEDAGDKRLTADDAADLTRDQLADHVYGPKEA